VSLELPAYNLCAGTGLAVALAWYDRRVRRGLGGLAGHAIDRATYLTIGVIACAFLGAVLYDRATGVSGGPLLPIRGLAFYGGLLGGGVAFVVGALALRLPLLELGDCIAPPLALGHAFGRLGCLLGGCCFGREVHPDGLLAGLGLERVPTQAFESLGLAALAVALARMPVRRAGDRALAYVAGYALLRSVLEIWRADARGQLFGLGNLVSPAQVTSLALVLGAAGVLVLRRARERTAHRPPATRAPKPYVSTNPT
jgi:phosphatidylglycerol:prolipoprotein diacylglycerol transferase